MLLTRLPLGIATSFDLHALGTPPAFILSQDQTLHTFLFPLQSFRPSSSFSGFDRSFPYFSHSLLAMLLYHSSIVNVLLSPALLPAKLIQLCRSPDRLVHQTRNIHFNRVLAWCNCLPYPICRVRVLEVVSVAIRSVLFEPSLEALE